MSSVQEPGTQNDAATRRRERIFRIIYFTIVLVVAIVPAVCTFYVQFAEKEYTIFGPGQVAVRHFDKWGSLNSRFCETFEVTPLLEADVFLVKAKARVDRRHRVISTRNTEQLDPDSANAKNYFYLLEGSNIVVNACKVNGTGPETASLLIFKGDDSYDSWKEGIISDPPIKNVTVGRKSICGQNNSIHLRYNILIRDTYYVALSGRPENFQANLTVSQTTFDTTHAHQSCSSSNECVFNLTYGSNVDIVVKYTDDHISFGTECTSLRNWFWFLVFVSSPLVLVLPILFLCWKKKLWRRCRREEANESEISHLLPDEDPPCYSDTQVKYP